jgi:hypothetical protein
VFGTGLDPTGLKRISVEGTDVPISSLTTRSNTVIAFLVPPILGISDSGQNVTLTVENNAGNTATATFYLLPGVATNLEATFTINRTTVSPTGALAANTPYDFTYSIEAYTSQDETYHLEPTLVNASAGWTVAVKGSSDLFIARSQPAPSTTSVVVTVTTGASGSATLAFGMRSKNYAGGTGSSQPEQVAIGQEPGQTSSDVTFMTPTVLGSVQKFTNGALYIRTDTTVANQVATINPLNVRLAQPGKYTFDTPVVSDGKWHIEQKNAPLTHDSTGIPNDIWGLIFKVTADANASDATAELPVVGDGSLPHASFTFMLKLRSDPSNPSPA